MQSRRNSTQPSDPRIAATPSCEESDDDWVREDRRDADRRLRPTRPWSGARGPARRELGRRATDRSGYVDRYSRRDVLLILTVLLMNVCDAFFTMLWLERGGREANPVMDYLLNIGPDAFLIQKCLVVGIWLVILLVHKNFRFARIGLYVSLAVYGFLVIMHFGVIALGIEPVAEPRFEPNRADDPRLWIRPSRTDGLIPDVELNPRVDRPASE